MVLKEFFAEHPQTAVALSGGVDSVYLLCAAKRYARNTCAYYVRSAFQPAFEERDAIKAAEAVGARIKVLTCDVLSEKAVTDNPADRCYHCKKKIFTLIKDAAAEDGFDTLVDGTNFSDDAADRPGMRALAELSVLSPLRLCGLTKADIRALSLKEGLFTHDKPSYACLATRIPTGTEITEERLARTEWAEGYLFSLGFSDFRVRMTARDEAKIQVTRADLNRREENGEEIKRTLGQRYAAVIFDREVRGG